MQQPDHESVGTAGGIAAALGLTVRGDAATPIRSASPFAEARAGSLTWLKALDDGSRAALHRLAGALVVVPAAASDEDRRCLDDAAGRNALLVAEHPRLVFARLLRHCFAHLELQLPAGVHPSACIDPTARLGRAVTIGAFCFVGAEVEIGDGSVLHPGVVVHSRTAVGRNCILGSGVVLGSRGFGFVRNERGELEHFPQIGRVVLEDDVEIQAGSMVVRPGLGETRVGRGSKIDQLCHVGHNARIGRHCVITACCEIGAAVSVADRAWIGPRSCSLEGVRLGEDSFVGIGATVLKDVPAGTVVAGNPAEPIDLLRKRSAAMRKLLDSADPPTAIGHGRPKE
jgi:UDP-3-O-[3-hydroxymyristoyl] glucosamine N-acyltransferase